MIDLESRLFLTVAEFAGLYGADARTVRRGISSGQIPSVRVSGTVRIPVPAVREMLGLPITGIGHHVSAA